MHPHFPNWHKLIEPTATEELHQKRWDLLNKYAKSLSGEQVIGILRLSCTLTAPDFLAEFGEKLSKTDDTFPPAPREALMGVMACGVIAAALSKKNHEADALALGLRAILTPGNNVTLVIPELKGLAETYLLEEADRMRPLLSDTSFSSVADSTNPKLEELEAAVTANQPPAVGKATGAAFKALLEGIKKDSAALDRRLTQLAEENQILWWIFGEYSPVLQKPISVLKSDDYALVLASEGASRCTVIPPAPSMDALFARTLARCSEPAKAKQEVSAFIDATGSAMAKRIVKGIQVKDKGELVPIVSALSSISEFEKHDLWIQRFSTFCPTFTIDTEKTPLEVCTQLFVELIFLKSLSNLT